jgi:hypothetical protein
MHLVPSGLWRWGAGPSSNQRAVHQILEVIIQLLGMRVQILNHLKHGLPGGNWRDTGIGEFFEYSCHVPSTETSPQSLLRCCVLKELGAFQERAASRKHFVPCASVSLRGDLMRTGSDDRQSDASDE